ncbi:hypothetical protein FRC00_004881, partial [Tulasnella sp. 408]
QQLQASNAAQTLLANLPPNVNPRDYILALQQLQNQNIAAQLGGQIPNLNLQNLAANLAGANSSAPTNQEEISTIFVVGFPDDMQEREFQNMFTFCPGFEAATLKVPNKELPSYGATGNTNAAQAAAAALQRAGIFPQSQQAFNGSNDPYNLLTTNSGGVVLDTANNGIWGGLANGEDAYRALNLPPGTDLSGLAPPAPRKQIIGFAKFRTRQEALDAREVLQGRRVDMEKGSVLKAEMAKKNLHTKRGVGPTTTTSSSNNPSSTGQLNLLNEALVNLANINGLAGVLQQQVQQQQQQQQQQQPQQPHGLQGLGGDMLSPRDRESAALAAMGLPGLTANRAVIDREREVAREKEREREMENQARARMGSVNLSAYDAFHSVPNGLPARPTTFPALPPSGSASLTPGITPALPASPSNQSSLYDGPRHPSAFNGMNGLGEGGHTLSNQPSFSSLGAAKDGNLWPTSFGSPVDPLDTVGAMGLGSSAAVGGPTANGLHPPASGSLSRKPSSLQGIHNTSSPEQLTISASQSGAGSPINGSGIFEQSQQSPAVPQGQPSAMNSPLKSGAQSAFSVNGLTNGSATSQGSSRNSAGSASPTERSQPTPQSSFDQFPNVNATTSSLGGAGGSGLYDSDLARAMSGLNVGTHQDLTSPQLPSPGSGRANAADQNPPINTLYVGNLPSNNQAHPTTLEDALRVLFSRCAGYRKLCFRQKSNGPMCFVEFDDVPCATKALNDLYGHTLNGLVKGGIRLSFSKNPLGVRTPSVSTAPSALNGGANLFTAALAGIGEGRFPQNHMMPTRHASLSVQSFGAEVSVARPTRQESVDALSGSSFGPFGFGQRSFSPPSASFGAPSQPTRTISQQLQPQPLSSHTHHSLIEGLNHLNSFSDPREHGSLANPAHNPTVISSSPQPGVEA